MFGYSPDPVDRRDFDFDSLGLASANDLRIRLYEWEARDQGATNSCVGFATAGALYLTEHSQGTAVAEPSPFMIYEQARRVSQPKGKLVDTGTHIRDAFKSLRRLGCCDESTWPTSKPVNASPGVAARFRGIGRKDGSYYRIYPTGQGRLDAIDAALKAAHPVVFGTAVSIRQLRLRGAILGPPDEYDGFHALVITGVHSVEGLRVYRVRNSWGKNSGDNGYVNMSSAYITSALSSDFWVCADWKRVRQ